MSKHAVIVKGYRYEPVQDNSPLFLRLYEGTQAEALEAAEEWADGRTIVGIANPLPDTGMRINLVKPVDTPRYQVTGPALTLG